MIRIAILDQNAYLLDKVASNRQQIRFAATTELDSENLSAWLAKNGVDMLVLQLPNENVQDAAGETTSEMLDDNGQACWRLNPSQLELVVPDGRIVPLSHNECCILWAAANANGKLVSRKILIAALGQEFWHYDERRLESLISRLRRKLDSYAPEGFPIRGVKGQGYLFKASLQKIET